jgi:hypothetical protein
MFSSQLRRPPPPLSGNDLVQMRGASDGPHNDGLQDAVLTYGLRQFLQLGLRESLSRLIVIDADLLDRYGAYDNAVRCPGERCDLWCGTCGCLQIRQSFSQSKLSSHANLLLLCKKNTHGVLFFALFPILAENLISCEIKNYHVLKMIKQAAAKALRAIILIA